MSYYEILSNWSIWTPIGSLEQTIPVVWQYICGNHNGKILDCYYLVTLHFFFFLNKN